MIKTTAVNLTNPESMMVTWDIGKRCNYDCSYCDALRHNNFSSHASLDTLVSTFKFIQEWTRLYNTKRITASSTGINFTGGEPTNNPNFWKLVEHIRSTDSTFELGLTTNGTWATDKLDIILRDFVGVTVSWHAEADKKLRDKALNNILNLSKAGKWLQVNVMLHTDLWDEAMAACDFLDHHGIKYNPVPIGDGNFDTSEWYKDKNGIMRRTTHAYTAEQQQWFFDKMKVPAESIEAAKGNKLGRTCCGGRCLTAKVDNEWKPVKLINTEFQGWNCMVDWYFMHIDQELNEVYHHQTCQALRGGKKGPIGTLDNTEEMLSNLSALLSQDTIDPIVCPNQRCGCGMCVPKAQSMIDFKEIWSNTISVPVREIPN